MNESAADLTKASGKPPQLAHGAFLLTGQGHGKMTKQLRIVAGPNGSGKTTWAHRALKNHGDAIYLSADQIAVALSPGRPEDARIAAGREFLRRFETALTAGESLIVEVTLSGRGIGRFIELARRQDYRISIGFIFLESAEICLLRIAQRVRKGGHPVPESDVRRRYLRSQQRFWHIYRHLVDEWHLFYNTQEWFELVATGQAGKVDIISQELFELFLENGGRDHEARRASAA